MSFSQWRDILASSLKYSTKMTFELMVLLASLTLGALAAVYRGYTWTSDQLVKLSYRVALGILALGGLLLVYLIFSGGPNASDYQRLTELRERAPRLHDPTFEDAAHRVRSALGEDYVLDADEYEVIDSGEAFVFPDEIASEAEPTTDGGPAASDSDDADSAAPA